MTFKAWLLGGPSGDVFTPLPPGEDREKLILALAELWGDDPDDFTATEVVLEVVKVNHIEEVE